MGKSVYKHQETGSEVIMCDRISDLPDDLLLHILSFLPSKQAVATSFLSKRWRPLRHSLPTLVIRDSSFPNLEVFLQFVDDVLISGDLAFIKKFDLNCWHFNVPPVKINIWINALVNSKVQHVEIWLPYRFNTRLPSSIFNHSTIRVLKLNGVTLNTFSTVHLPCLKVIRFSSVRFPNLKCVAILLSGCPLLEDLVLKRLDINTNGPLDIGKLKHLVTANVPPSLMPLRAFSNVTFLSLSGGIWSPSDDIPTFYNVTHLACYAVGWTRLVNCLRNFPKLENLVIYELGYTDPPQPVLGAPQCLSSRLKDFTLDSFNFSGSEFEILRFVMKNAKVLRTINIRSDFAGSIEEQRLQVLNELSSYPTSSENCTVLFDNCKESLEPMKWCHNLLSEQRFVEQLIR